MNTVVLSAVMLVGLPIGLLLILKANAGIMFFAACAGFVLLGSLDPSVVTTASALVPGEGEAYIRFSVVLLSVLFAAMMFRNAVSGSKILLHLLIAILLGLSLWLLLPGSTGVTWLQDNATNDVWLDFYEFRSLIIAGAFSLSLLAMLIKPPKHKKDKH